ncbi:uncharacterized protein LOC118735433 [Rhagoletis pomonella]|uniref:uncharacterized protein LOC118735433 n=1 Tax=Rhagoletis pomonella TaxID=28610 RepID=UPI00178193F8|nr:uncharacterized protein LOC118735433 [Rhagoletis pomonella]
MKRRLPLRKVKKWTQDEISKIIDYMIENGNIEKPTARAYYETFLKISPIDASWDLIKWKVRYLRTIYTKTEQWINSTEASILDNDEFDAKLTKMCPNYYRLQKIFGEKRAEIIEILDSNSSFADCYDEYDENTQFTEDIKVFEDYNEMSNFCPEGFIERANSTKNSHFEDLEQSESTQISTPHSILVPEISINEPGSTETVQTAPDLDADAAIAKKLKKESLRQSLSALSQSQEGRNETQRLRLKFEEYKFAQEFAFIKEKFQAEQELKKQEIELKRMEIESNEKLRILEMEKNERIARYELNLKYNGHGRYSSNLHEDLRL